jgi:hypothetical protein
MTERNSFMTRIKGTLLAIAALVLALPACDDEILTDVDIPKDASTDRGTDAPREGASADGASEGAPKADAAAETSDDGPATDAAATDAEAGDDGAPSGD